jgi:hypothetical protein
LRHVLFVVFVFSFFLIQVTGKCVAVLDPSETVGPMGRYLMGVTVCPVTDEIFIADEKRHRVVGLSLVETLVGIVFLLF